MNKLQSSIYKALFRVRSFIPKEYSDELHMSRLYTNISRERTLSFILIAASALLIYYDLTYLVIKNSYLVILLGAHLTLLTLAIFFLICSYLKMKQSAANTIFLKLLYILIATLILDICAFLTAISRVSGQPPYAYIVALFSISSMIIFTWKESIFIYSISYIVYVAGTLTSQQINGSTYISLLFTFLLMILALIITISNYILYVNNFKKTKVIIEKNIELEHIKKITDELLEKRTSELHNAIEYEKLRTNFFTNLSHELRTPLNVIFSAEQMVSKKLKNPEANEDQHEIGQYMAIIKQNCYRLTRLISNLIDITKFDAGYLKVNLRDNNIVKVVEDITLSVAKYIENSGISLTFDTEAQEIFTSFDPEMIERIVLNLLSNAVKFTPKGGSILVNIYRSEDTVYISIKDTGIGIPDNMKSLIFERFVQVDNTISRTREGSGIGLSLVKSLVQLHNGSISLISKEGAGSEFLVSIPVQTTLAENSREDAAKISVKPNIQKINIEFSDIYF